MPLPTLCTIGIARSVPSSTDFLTRDPRRPPYVQVRAYCRLLRPLAEVNRLLRAVLDIL